MIRALALVMLAVLTVGAPAPTYHREVAARTITIERAHIAEPEIVTAMDGDSISAGWAPMDSWMLYVTDPKITFDLGAFKVGLRSDEIVDSQLARGIPDVDVLVVMGCTNDIAQGIDWHACLASWDRLDTATDLPIVVGAAAPSNWLPGPTLEYNAALEAHAAMVGWTFVDGYAAVRAADGTYLPGFQRDPENDPTHPNNAAQALAGAAFTVAIRKAAS